MKTESPDCFSRVFCVSVEVIHRNHLKGQVQRVSSDPEKPRLTFSQGRSAVHRSQRESQPQITKPFHFRFIQMKGKGCRKTVLKHSYVKLSKWNFDAASWCRCYGERPQSDRCLSMCQSMADGTQSACEKDAGVTRHQLFFVFRSRLL